MIEEGEQFEHRCLRCGKRWWTPVKAPKACKGCGSKLWAKPRVRGIGGGRKKKENGAATFDAGKLGPADPRKVVRDLAEIDRVMKEAGEDEITVDPNFDFE